MDIAWEDLGAAFALMLVFEGLIPFLSPSRMRATYARIVQLDDRQLRYVGFFSMIAGIGILTLLRS